MVPLEQLSEHFPFPHIRQVQDEAFQAIAASPNGILLEIPTGSGKTAIGLAALRAVAMAEDGPLFYVTPTKIQVEQVIKSFPEDTVVIYGRSDYPCLYYSDHGVHGVTAEASPCYMLSCPHRVDQETGETVGEGALPCPYFQAKFAALTAAESGKIVVSTTAFFLKNRFSVKRWREAEPALVVVDEVHRLAKTARGIFEYTMTNHSLERAKDALSLLDPDQAKILGRFLTLFKKIAHTRPSRSASLLAEEEIEKMVKVLETMNSSKIEGLVREAIERGLLDPVAHKDEIKVLENISRSIPRFVTSLRFATTGESRKPLTYVVAFYYSESDPESATRKATHYLTIKSYFVAPIIKKALGQNVIGYSATIGDPNILAWETGLKLPFKSFGSSFATENTKVFMPKDTTDLSQKRRRRDDLKNSLKLIARTVKEFSDKSLRSLVVVVSDEERRNFIGIAERNGLNVISYGNGVMAKDAAMRFKDGEGDVLVGTSAHYSEGVDLPKGIAPIIFYLRPGYQRPDDPETQFEERRFSQGHCWALWNWRVMIEALQTRGRNIRTESDLGVCFFISQQFRRFLYGSLPEWLKSAYDGKSSMQEAVDSILEFFDNQG